ncbi:MAG: hypothetical protein AUK44_01805 [Porphyromonadaceae bacterium CG2_30_38_12]|nr:MAG: hypothetical protein AUK44_01805 [Porphyromonadaceae bacterium CG2_30_38_12]
MYSNNISLYREFCSQNSQVPLFIQPWWMDAVCPKFKWNVLLFTKKNQILGVWVFQVFEKWGFKLIIQPQLTQYNGIWINRPDNLSDNKVISFDNKVITNLLKQFESVKFSYFDQNFHHSFSNWLPFYWRGFKQTTRYTYQIKNILDTDKCFEEFNYDKRNLIKKSINKLTCTHTLSGEDFYKITKENLAKLGKKISYSESTFLALYRASTERGQSAVLACYDDANTLHAALFLVWDEHVAYNLISTINPDLKASGGSALVVWEAIKFLKDKTQIFDFEGSMIESVENSFRHFGTSQVPYFRVRKYNSFVFRLLYLLKNI